MYFFEKLKGYVQGMSDLLSPIMVIMTNEVDSFWCFAGFMEKIVDNLNSFLNVFYQILKFINN